MKNWSKIINKYKSISWMLIAAILMLTFLPAHYHMHHVASVNSSHHDHVIDFHVAGEQTVPSHHAGVIHSFSATPDGMLKKTNPAFSFFIILVLFPALLPLFTHRIRIRPGSNIIGLKQSYPHFSPPLRAPPM